MNAVKLILNDYNSKGRTKRSSRATCVREEEEVLASACLVFLSSTSCGFDGDPCLMGDLLDVRKIIPLRYPKTFQRFLCDLQDILQ